MNHSIRHIITTALILLFVMISFGICTAAEKVYVLTAPYPTVTDSITVRRISRFWRGVPYGLPFRELLMTPETLDDLIRIWGNPSGKAELKIIRPEKMLQTAWEGDGTWAVIPFEELDPRWKVIAVNGSSPFLTGFDPADYALSVPLPEGEPSNYDPEKLTTLTLTGTTAMSRYLAYHIETDGLLVPVENIAETLAASDITHISNEASFTPDCPPGDPLRREARFCSDPSYFALLEAVGADVVELTGNHNLDWGYEPFLYSLDLYEQAGMKVYGGGRTQKEAQEPLLLEHHGNKIALFGCNAIGPDGIWATDENPGAALCDLPKMEEQIRELKADGWLPVVTFQHLEYTWYDVPPLQSHDFLEIAREAGPAVISGSQAHIPQGMTFVGDTFIHYGLGNLLFDQMSDVERTSFFDRHYFYDGRYLGNHLETIILENYSQPRFLDPEEREAFLNLIFGTCSWQETFAEN
ncbi:MAG: CapA family protein [Anaerolineaceae bacterium]|nr:CapA family protein [Anaerolineaceae bacterium]